MSRVMNRGMSRVMSMQDQPIDMRDFGMDTITLAEIGRAHV